MTSNIGSHIILENTVNNLISSESFEETKSEVMQLMKSQFKPEFLNRIDEIVFFKGLNINDLSQIVDIQLHHLERLLIEQNMHAQITQEAKEILSNWGYEPAYGARPLKRVIMQKIETPLSKKILEGEFVTGDNILIDSQDDEIIFRKTTL